MEPPGKRIMHADFQMHLIATINIGLDSGTELTDLTGQTRGLAKASNLLAMPA
jgi:hypothetical protein